MGVIILMFAGKANASLITIDFEADTVGFKSNGFIPTGTSGVNFYDSVGEELYVLDAGVQGSGLRSLAVLSEIDGGQLEIGLDFTADFFSLDFGNDDPVVTNAGDLAVLTAFMGAIQMGQTTVALNRDDVMNQTISFGAIDGGVFFDYLHFGYTNEFFSLFTGGGAVGFGSAEVVDNIMINQAAPIPEPGTMALLAIGMAGVGLCRRFFKKTTERL